MKPVFYIIQYENWKKKIDIYIWLMLCPLLCILLGVSGFKLVPLLIMFRWSKWCLPGFSTKKSHFSLLCSKYFLEVILRLCKNPILIKHSSNWFAYFSINKRIPILFSGSWSITILIWGSYFSRFDFWKPCQSCSYVFNISPHSWTLPYLMVQKEVPVSSGTFHTLALAFHHGTLVPFSEEMFTNQRHYVTNCYRGWSCSQSFSGERGGECM